MMTSSNTYSNFPFAQKDVHLHFWERCWGRVEPKIMTRFQWRSENSSFKRGSTSRLKKRMTSWEKLFKRLDLLREMPLLSFDNEILRQGGDVSRKKNDHVSVMKWMRVSTILKRGRIAFICSEKKVFSSLIEILQGSGVRQEIFHVEKLRPMVVDTDRTSIFSDWAHVISKILCKVCRLTSFSLVFRPPALNSPLESDSIHVFHAPMTLTSMHTATPPLPLSSESHCQRLPCEP